MKSNNKTESANINNWRVSIETVTCEKAAAMLAMTHSSQRKINRSSVAQYVRDMQADRFVLTPEPIVFTDTGHLIDGQHRLTAVVSSGKPTRFLVIRGVDESTMPWLNIGRSRTCSDIVKISGKDISKRDMSVASHIETLDNMRSFDGITRWERISLAEKYADELEWVKSHPVINAGGRRAVAAVDAAFAWMSSDAPDASEVVLNGIVSGEWSGGTDPIGHLWKYLNGAGYESSRKTRLGKIFASAKVVNTIMLTEQGREIKKLQVSPAAMHSAWCRIGVGPTSEGTCIHVACSLPAAGGACILHRAIEEQRRSR